MTKNTCDTCRYYTKLTDSGESYGMCNWSDNNTPELPWWATPLKSYGAIHPKASGCRAWANRFTAEEQDD